MLIDGHVAYLFFNKLVLNLCESLLFVINLYSVLLWINVMIPSYQIEAISVCCQRAQAHYPLPAFPNHLQFCLRLLVDEGLHVRFTVTYLGQSIGEK